MLSGINGLRDILGVCLFASTLEKRFSSGLVWMKSHIIIFKINRGIRNIC
ncbi:hypothetical protein SynROS8604_03321 [Synechococcus sp. ROS8604]|nr:hypothetical protein SynROS8604_03321 [Synechococcus sp. ROS8604]